MDQLQGSSGSELQPATNQWLIGDSRLESSGGAVNIPSDANPLNLTDQVA